MQNDPPYYHVLYQSLFIEDFTKLLFSLHVFGWSRKDFKREVSVVRQEGLAKIRELYSFCIFNIKVSNKGLYFWLRIVNLHLK